MRALALWWLVVWHLPKVLANASGTMSHEQWQEYQEHAYALMASIEGNSPAIETLRRRLQALAQEAETTSTAPAAAEHIEADVQAEMAEEEEEFTEVDIGCSWTLTGALIFAMIIFYFVNWPDDDIKRYTWSIINTTLSIFVAVMSFQGCEEVLMEFVIHPILGAFPTGSAAIARVLCGFGVFLGWLAVAHLVIAWFAGLVCNGEDASKLMERKWVVADAMRGDHGEEVPVANVVQGHHSKGIASVKGVEVFVSSRAVLHEGYERRTKCWAMLFAHMAGFAMISAGGDLQHWDPFMSSPAYSWLAVVICAVFLLLIFSFTARCLYQEGGEFAEARKLYKEEGKDAEDDIFCLAVSFLCVQSLRFTFSGSLPSKLGFYHSVETEARQATALYVSAVAMVVVMVVTALFLRGECVNARLKSLIVGTASMGFAWCVLFGTRAFFDSWSFLEEKKITPATIEGRVLLAMAASLFSCAVIVVLDKIEDGLQDSDGEQLHKLLKNIITGLSILIGFTWEHTFDGCVEAMSSLWSEKLLGKLTMTLTIVVIVVPAWRRFILAKVVDLQKMQHEKKGAQAKIQDGYAQPMSEGSSSEEESTARLMC